MIIHICTTALPSAHDLIQARHHIKMSSCRGRSRGGCCTCCHRREQHNIEIGTSRAAACWSSCRSSPLCGRPLVRPLPHAFLSELEFLTWMLQSMTLEKHRLCTATKKVQSMRPLLGRLVVGVLCQHDAVEALGTGTAGSEAPA